MILDPSHEPPQVLLVSYNSWNLNCYLIPSCCYGNILHAHGVQPPEAKVQDFWLLLPHAYYEKDLLAGCTLSAGKQEI